MSDIKKELIGHLNSKLKQLRDEIVANKRVLVVDDEEIITLVMENLLSQEGYEVDIALNVSQARKLLKERKPILVLLDKNLPDESGLDLLGDISKMDDPPETIMMTGYASYDSVIEAMHLGASAYLTKPFNSLNEVRAKAKSAIARKRRARLNRAFVEELKRVLDIWMSKTTELETTQLFLRQLQENLAVFKEERLSKKKIIVVDAEESLQTFLPEIESDDSFVVDFCSRGREAIELLKTREYNLLIADKNLPDVDGLNVIVEGRKLQPDMAIIVQTAYASMDEAIAAMANGVNEYISKPIENIEVYRKIIHGSVETSQQNLRYRKLVQELRNLFVQVISNDEKKYHFLLHILEENATDRENAPEKKVEEVNDQAPKKEVTAAKTAVAENSTFHVVDKAVMAISDPVFKPSVAAREIKFKRSTVKAPAEIESLAVLIVDDEPIIIMVIEEIIIQMGIKNLYTALSAEEAWGKFVSKKIDLVITDKNLPGISGLDLMKKIRNLDSDVALIMITGYSSLDVATQALELGVADYICKPFENINQVRNIIGRVLDKQIEMSSIRVKLDTLEKEQRLLKQRLGKLGTSLQI
jgi:DNA-binding NtrC family response regulator